jgi:pimeloyl-ACP methyl ester carboxylesterase
MLRKACTGRSSVTHSSADTVAVACLQQFDPGGMRLLHRYTYLLMVAVLVTALSCAPRTAPEKQPQAPEGLAITVRGRGPDVVLIHGALGDYRQWEPIGDLLSDGYRVIAVSRRYHWPNLRPAASDYTFDAQSADLDTLLRSLGHPVHLVGHSHGAGIALLTALRHPELVRSLALIELPFASLVSPSAPGFTGELASRDSMVKALRANVAAGADERAAEVLIDWAQGEPDGFQRLPQAVQEVLRANAPTIGPSFARPAPPVTCEQLHALSLPVLMLRGERAPLLSNHRRGGRWLHSRCAGCHHSGCGAYDDRGESDRHRQTHCRLHRTPLGASVYSSNTLMRNFICSNDDIAWR